MDDEAFTVGDLRRHLQGLKDDHKLTFAGGLTLYRVKRVAGDESFIEFNEAEGDLAPSFKTKNPNVKVVFMDTAKADRNDSGTIGSMDVGVR